MGNLTRLTNWNIVPVLMILTGDVTNHDKFDDCTIMTSNIQSFKVKGNDYIIKTRNTEYYCSKDSMSDELKDTLSSFRIGDGSVDDFLKTLLLIEFKQLKDVDLDE